MGASGHSHFHNIRTSIAQDDHLTISWIQLIDDRAIVVRLQAQVKVAILTAEMAGSVGSCAVGLSIQDLAMVIARPAP